MNSHKVEINKSFALWKKVGILSYFYSAIRPPTPPQSAPFRNGPARSLQNVKKQCEFKPIN